RCRNRLPNRQMRPDFFQNILDGRCARRKAMNQVCVFADQSEQQVFGLDGHTPELTRLIAGEENDSARSFGVPFKHSRIVSTRPVRYSLSSWFSIFAV